MHTPLIAVVPSYDEKRRVRIPPAYLTSLSECGAIGVVIPYAEDAKTINEYAARFDGFLFSGGFVAIGELAVLFVLGLPLSVFLEKSKLSKKLFIKR